MLGRLIGLRFSSVAFSRGAATYQHNENVQLRGVRLGGRSNDLPNLIFLPETFDLVENWIPFFTDPENKILDYRNVHIIYPRNFGNSDHNESFDLQDVSNDVVRYMWENKITSATLAGHGYGGKVALATGCFHPERSTGVFVIDSSPMDHRYHESFRELKSYVERLAQFDLSRGRGQLESFLKENVPCPKWRSLFSQNVHRVGGREGQFAWKFAMDFIHHNLQFNKGDSIGRWPVKAGLYPGRVQFIFPEFSRWVHLGTNTLPMLKICPQNKGFLHDIFQLQGDENPLNHWMYDFPEHAFTLAHKFTRFLSHKDGVHVLLYDRSEVGKFSIPDRLGSRNDPNHVYGDYIPAHHHHNWRYQQ